MYFAWLEHRLRSIYNSWLILLSLQGLSLGFWTYLIWPLLQTGGLLRAVDTLNSSVYSGLILVCLVLSFGWTCLINAKLVNLYILFPLNSLELRQVLQELISINLPVQFLLILLSSTDLAADSLLLYLFSYTLYALLRSGCSIISIRIHSHHFANLRILNTIVLIGTLVYALSTTYLFGFKGVKTLVTLHFEAVFILMESLKSSYALRVNEELPNGVSLGLAISENLLKLVQWVYLIGAFFCVTSLNPIYIVVLLKAQHYCYLLGSNLVQLRNYQRSLKLFHSYYTVLSVEELKEDVCCICFDSLHIQPCSRIRCTHVFHVKCLHRWMSYSRKQKCPVCSELYLERKSE